jgi:hypothetical protein
MEKSGTHTNLKHYASPMVHPVTGEIISSYKKAMKDPTISEVWKTSFGKEFGGLAQGNNKTGTKGRNAIFVIPTTISNGTKVESIHRPQKADPNRIRITAGGNLINYDDELSVRTTDITTAKLHWNSVISTDNARYMCLDLSLFYLTKPRLL